MIELYGARTGNCLRVSVALEEAGISYQTRPVDLRRGEHLGEAYRAINQEGKVPALVEEQGDGSRFILTQSNAILFHLAERAPGTLLPSTAMPRALALQRFFYLLTDVIGPNHAAFRLRIEGRDPSGEVLTRLAAKMLAAAEPFLEETPFISGDTFGLADIAAVTTLPTLLSEADLAGFPRLHRWYRDAVARPSVVRGMSAFDPVPGSGV